MVTAADEEKNNGSIVSPIFQIILIAINAIAISIAISIGLTSYRNTEKEPLLQTLTPAKVIAFGGLPQTVIVGLNIQDFQTFDVINKKFVFNGTVWFLLNPGFISLKTLSKFEFAQGQILEKGEPKTEIIDNKLFVEFPIRVQFTSPLDFNYFPIDDHNIHIIFTHPQLSPEEMNLQSWQQYFTDLSDEKSLGWERIDTNVYNGYSDIQLDEFDENKEQLIPTVVFELKYSRYGSRYIVSILLPLLLIFYLSLFSLSSTHRTAISLATGSVTAILAYRFVIENLSPNSGYFMLSDYIFFMFLMATVFVFFLVMLESFEFHLPKTVKKLFVVGIHMFVIGATYYFFVF